jgi:hypothetical protein
MRIYTVHLGPRSGPYAEAVGARDLIAVKEGFSWPAFFFTALWALWHRMWLVAIAMVLVPAVIDTATLHLDEVVRGLIDFTILVVIGMFANDWRRRDLARRGYEDVGVVAARGLDAAELRAAEKLGLPSLAPAGFAAR